MGRPRPASWAPDRLACAGASEPLVAAGPGQASPPPRHVIVADFCPKTSQGHSIDVGGRSRASCGGRRGGHGTLLLAAPATPPQPARPSPRPPPLPPQDGVARAYAAVFDGHNGAGAAEHAADRLHHLLAGHPALRAATGDGPPAAVLQARRR